MRIFTDFDGPIADLSDRYYHVYRLCLAQTTPVEDRQIRILTKAEYWNLKRAKVSEIDVAIKSGLSPAQAQLFKQIRDRFAHHWDYIEQFDRIVPGAIDALVQIQRLDIELYTMTLRRETELDITCRQFQLDRFFPLSHRYCIQDGDLRTADIELKTELMARAITELKSCSQSWMIGDTETDILAARAHGIKSIAVLSGIRDRDRLLKYQPDFIVPNLTAAVELIRVNLSIENS
jgi:phosphoglycolate phosphatase-like HAD superfamily hydrolase